MVTTDDFYDSLHAAAVVLREAARRVVSKGGIITFAFMVGRGSELLSGSMYLSYRKPDAIDSNLPELPNGRRVHTLQELFGHTVYLKSHALSSPEVGPVSFLACLNCNCPEFYLR